jgi:hypothetical protein
VVDHFALGVEPGVGAFPNSGVLGKNCHVFHGFQVEW